MRTCHLRRDADLYLVPQYPLVPEPLRGRRGTVRDHQRRQREHPHMSSGWGILAFL